MSANSGSDEEDTRDRSHGLDFNGRAEAIGSGLCILLGR